MAAGKFNDSRREDSSYFPKRTIDRFVGGNVVELKKVGVESKDVLGLENDVRRRSKNGHVFFWEGVQTRGKGAMAVDGGIVSPPEKRRKLSPVVCNGEQNGSPMYGHSLFDDQEPGQLDDEDFSNAPNIFTSRWAHDDDEDDHKGKGSKSGEEMKGTRASPESGITQKEDSDSSAVRSSESDGKRFLLSYSGDEYSEKELDNDHCMENDVAGKYVDSIDEEFDSDSGDGPEAGAPEHGRNMLQACRSVFEYENLGKINEGSYGIVYKSRDKKTGEMVALKKLKMGDNREGFPLYYLREINTLLSLNHPSIVTVREVVVDDSFDGFDNIYLAMDYVEHDIKALVQARKQPFSQSEVKCLMLQLLEGVKYLHDNWVLHRDLKTSNLLLNNKGELKICDFGMSRQYGTPLNPYTALVVTLWYRAPELLLGVKEYSTGVDMWSVGCIMAELLLGKPLFDGKTELEQLNKIFKTLGTPNDKIWPGCSQLHGVKANLVHQPYWLLHKKFPCASFTGSPSLSDLGLDLLSKLLTYDPSKRITAEEALCHRWFQEVPLPKSKDFMPTFPVDKAAEGSGKSSFLWTTSILGRMEAIISYLECVVEGFFLVNIVCRIFHPFSV